PLMRDDLPAAIALEPYVKALQRLESIIVLGTPHAASVRHDGSLAKQADAVVIGRNGTPMGGGSGLDVLQRLRLSAHPARLIREHVVVRQDLADSRDVPFRLGRG